MKTEIKDQLEEVCIGALVAVKIGAEWSRVKILDTDPFSGFVGLCVDFGNICSSKTVYALPDELRNVPPLATHCSLPLPENLNAWPQVVDEEFVDLTQTSGSEFEVTVLEKIENMVVVNLTCEGIDVLKRVHELCQASAKFSG